MNEENQNPVTPVETEIETVETAPETEYSVSPASGEVVEGNKNRLYFIIAAVVAVFILLGGLVYAMEKSGRLNTGIFDGIERARLANSTVATVNGNDISQYDLQISMEQIAAAATAQGVDTNDADVKASIKEQAIEMLINTELLKQEAAARGISVTKVDVDARYEQLVTEVGGEEVLQERMNQFGVTDTILKRDIENELTIQKLLDLVFAETDIAASDEEVAEMYASAGGESAGLPALAEVKEQIEQQITATKEQEIVNDYVDSLRDKAVVDIEIEL